MNKFLTALLLALALLCFGCGGQQGASADGKMQVAASFYPMAEFARAVGGDRATVYTMIGDGIEPHDWEPSARDLTRLAKAKVFVYTWLMTACRRWKRGRPLCSSLIKPTRIFG